MCKPLDSIPTNAKEKRGRRERKKKKEVEPNEQKSKIKNKQTTYHSIKIKQTYCEKSRIAEHLGMYNKD
jgi:hypothetical protein